MKRRNYFKIQGIFNNTEPIARKIIFTYILISIAILTFCSVMYFNMAKTIFHHREVRTALAILKPLEDFSTKIYSIKNDIKEDKRLESKKIITDEINELAEPLQKIIEISKIDSIRTLQAKSLSYIVHRIYSINERYSTDSLNITHEERVRKILFYLYIDRLEKQTHLIEEKERHLLQFEVSLEENRLKSTFSLIIILTLSVFLFLIYNFSYIRREYNAKRKAENDNRILTVLIEQTMAAIITLDAKGYITSWNKGVEKIDGYTQEEIIGKHYSIFYTPEQRELNQPNLNLNMAAESGSFEVEGWRLKKDGTRYWGSITITAMYDKYQRLQGFTKVIYDNTSRKLAEENLAELNAELELKIEERTLELSKSEKRYRALVENSFDAVTLIDENGYAKYLSPAATKIGGYTLKERRRLSLMDVMADESQEELKQIFEQVAKSPGLAIPFALKAKHKNGNYFWAEGRVMNLMHDPDINAYVINYRDITETRNIQVQLRKTENRFRAMVENAEDIIALTNAEGTVSYISPALEKLTGYSFQDVQEKGITIIFDPEYLQESRDVINLCIQNPGKTYPRKTRIKCKDGGFLDLVGTTTNLLHDEDVSAILSNFHDVTETKKAEDKLIASEKRFRSLIENADDILVLTDEQINFTYQSPSFIKKSGYTAEELSKMSWQEISDPIYIEETTKVLTDALQNPGKVLTLRNRLRKKDGNFVELRGTITNMLHDPNVNAIVANFHDITLAYQAEEKLLASEQRFRSLIENSSDLVLLMDEQYNILYRSPSAERLTGFTDAEVIGKCCIDFTHRDDIEENKRKFNQLFIEPDKHVNIRYRKLHKDGHYTWFEGIAMNHLNNPYVNAIVFNIREIQERVEAEEKLKESESRFRSLIENSSDLILLLDENLRILYRSPSAERITGFTDNEMLGTVCTNYNHPDELESNKEKLIQLFEHPERPVPLKFRKIHKDGHYIWFDGIAINQLHNPNVRALVFNLRDVSERILAEQKVIDSEKQFRALVENNTSMIYTLDANLKTKYRSPSATIITGRSNEESSNWFSMDLIHPEDKTMMYEVLQEVFEKPDVAIPINIRTLHKDNHYIALEGTITNKLHDPAIEALVINLQDVTFKKQAEEKLLETKANLKTILDNAHSGYILMDTSLRVITTNKVAEDFALYYLGIDKADENYILGCVPPNRKAIVTEYLSQALQGETINYETSYTSKEGEQRHYNFTIFPIQVNEQITGIMMSFDDITERKLSEQAILKAKSNLDAIIENNQVDIYSLDTNFNIITMNKRLSSRLKENYNLSLNPGDNIVEAFNRIMPEEEARWIVLYNRALKGESVNEILDSIENEQQVFISLSINPIFENGKVNGLAIFSIDVTKEVIAERKIQEAKANLNAIIENYDAYIYSLDRNLNYIAINQKHQKWLKEIYGLNFNVGDHVIDFLKSDNDYVYNQWLSIYTNSFEGKKQEFVREQISQDGLHFLKYSINPIIENGVTTALSCIAIDITEQRKADEIILRTKANLNAIIENYDACIFSIDRDMRYITLNQKQKNQMFEFYGVHLKEGDSSINFLKSLHPKHYQGMKEHFMRALSGEKLEVILESNLNNETRFLRFSANPIVENGIITSLSCFSVDITEQRKNDMQMMLNYKAVENAAEGIIITDNTVQGNPIIYANKGFERITGYSVHEMIGKTSAILRGKDTSVDTMKNIRESLRNKQTFEGEILNYRKDGTPFWNFLRINPIFDSKNNITHYVGFQNDITERKKIEQEIHETNESLRNLSSHLETVREEERADISREIHDELGQELTGLKMSLESIKKKASNDMELFYQSVDAIELVNTTISTVRRIATELRPGILDDLGLEAAVEWHTKEFEKKSGIHCVLETDNLSERYSKQQSISIYRIFQESMTNIGRHSGANAVRIKLYEKEKTLFLSVEDNGKGFTLKLDKLRSLGIIGMRERARIINANFDITKGVRGGTKVSLEVPLL